MSRIKSVITERRNAYERAVEIHEQHRHELFARDKDDLEEEDDDSKPDYTSKIIYRNNRLERNRSDI